MARDSENHQSIEAMIAKYISEELVSDPGGLAIESDTPLLEPHIIDSLSLLKLVLFLEKEFGIAVGQDELVPVNFSTIRTLCAYIRNKNVKKA